MTFPQRHPGLGTPIAPRIAVRIAAGVLLLAHLGCASGPPSASDAGARPRAAASAGRPDVWHPALPDTGGPIVAVIRGMKLTRHDVDSVVATAPPDLQPRFKTFEGYRQLVERMTFEEALLQAAAGANIETDPQYLAEVARASRSAKMRIYYNRRVAAIPPPTDSMLLAYYDEHQSEYHVPARAKVRHIQLSTQAEAQRVRRRLVGGALWDETCRKVSKDGLSKERGGLIGYVSQESDMVPGVGKAPAIVAAAFEIKEKEISQPLKSEKGWHLIRVDEREGASMRTFDEVKEQIRRTVETKQVDDFSTAYTESLRTAAGITIFDDSIKVALQPARDAKDFFKEAQAAVNARDRIALYRQVIERFPQDSVTAQARFMIGFTYAEDLGDYEEARKAFQEFLRLHPDSELRQSAQWMLENMDKPPPAMEEDGAPPDSTAAPPNGGGDGAPERMRRSP